jgi:hypothetical protein
VLALLSIGCTARPTEPPIVGEPLPGSIHLTAIPPRAPRPLSLRVETIGGPGISVEIEERDEIVADWGALPLPEEKWIEVNGQDCEGTFGVRERFETDLLLVLTDDACRVQVLGVHPEGGSHIGPRAS